MKPFAQQTYYELLEVPVTAPMEEIRAAYSRLMELYAPDSIAVYALVEPDQVDALRARMTEAMEILTDGDLRGEYDRDLGLTAPWGTVKAAEALASAVEEGKKPRASEDEAPALSGPEAFRASFVSGYSLSYVTSSLQTAPLVGGLLDVPASLSVGAEAQASTSGLEPAESSGAVASAPSENAVEQGSAQRAPRQESVSVGAPASVAAASVAQSVESAPVAAPPVAVSPSAPVAPVPSESSPSAAPVPAASVSTGDSSSVPAPVAAAPVAVAPPVESAPPVASAPVVVAPQVEAAPVASTPPVDPSPAHVATVSPPPAPIAASPDVPASVPTQPSETVTSIVVAGTPARAPEPAPTPVTRPVGPTAPPVSSSQNRVQPGRQLSEAQVLAQDSAIATAEAALAQVAARTREPRPRLPDIPADAEFNGELLRRVRETRGYTLQQVADRTRISSRHLENVEADRYTALPAQVYLRGILMNLARELGLDPLRVSRSYLALASEKSGKK
ncbi:DnaJ domain-containing protein [Myxococcus fulvus]|uniref:DnaJ domain-containing protein n=1 Tax=Myxococcus fulvus TaxID=33 RepID=A0A511TDY3_MYXFU|nr:helix-turn-helix domain-containing protein [Myxococcus fulvus]GEN12376.1 hypothetical protein MFU01_74130 [Myxococcus fulvus]SET75048.1 DnaJ domain-containing protein [Myxococcus fulvus]